MYEDYSTTGSRSKKIYSTFNMAARREGDDLPARCISLLEEVRNLIEAQKNKSSGTQSEPQPSTSSLVPQVQQRDQRVMQNFRSLFAPYNSAGVSCARPPPAKKSRVSFQVKETWTHEFFCLGSTTATCVPSRAQEIALQNAGLGRRKVVFHCEASSIDVKTKLESVYPKLIQGGGFEILRSGSPSFKLSLITPPTGGYSVPFLWDSAGLGQALAYIRPLQKDLDTSAFQSDEQVCSFEWLIFSV